jgi:hypothetical protein
MENKQALFEWPRYDLITGMETFFTTAKYKRDTEKERIRAKRNYQKKIQGERTYKTKKNYGTEQ